MKRLLALIVAMATVAAVGVVLLTRTPAGSATPRDAAAPVAQTSAAAVPTATGGAGAVGGVGTARATTAPKGSTTKDGAPGDRPAAASTPARTAARTKAAKKGAAVWQAPGLTTAMKDSGVSWYYNWAADHNGVTAPRGVEYVPMIWGAKSVTTANLAAARRNGKVLLGFNEPDLAGQAEMSVEQALALWPKLQATGMTLGAPAVAYGADTDGGWLDRFMTGAKQKGYRVDFIPLHWYGSDFSSPRAVKQLKTYLDATYRKYKKPIWLTEYALMNFGGGAKYPPAATQAAFVTASTAMLQKLSYLRRYAWFGLPTSTDGSEGTGLYRGGVPNRSGTAYRAAG